MLYFWRLKGADSCDAIWDNSILSACFNSRFIISKLQMCCSSTALLQASCYCLCSSSTSFLISSLIPLMISGNCCWLIDGEDVLEAHDTLLKYWLIVTPVLVTRTCPRCSGRLMVVFSISWRLCRTKLPCVACSFNESYMQIYLLNFNKIKLNVS